MIIKKGVREMEKRLWLTRGEMISVFQLPLSTMRNYIRQGTVEPTRGKIFVEHASQQFDVEEIKKVVERRGVIPDFSRLSEKKKEGINWHWIREEIEKARSGN